jgi:hypothetical protein
VAVSQSADGRVLGSPRVVGTFRTPPSQTPPQPLAGLEISSVVGPDRFTVAGLGQDKPGFAYVIVTKPRNQAANGKVRRAACVQRFCRRAAAALPHPDAFLFGPQVAPGTGSAFAAVPGARRRRARQLRQATSLAVLPPEAAAPAAGTAMLPPCAAQVACSAADAVEGYIAAGAEAVVHSECVAVQRITDVSSVVASSLQNDTLYRVLLVTRDTAGQEGTFAAFVRTQDLTPPALTVLDAPPPDFTAFQLVVTLNEAGTVFAGLHVADINVSAAAACPPSFAVSARGGLGGAGLGAAEAGRLLASNRLCALPAGCRTHPKPSHPPPQPPGLAEASVEVAGAGANATLTFAAGLTPNTDYTLRLIARDAAGNCQNRFTDVAVHTADNAPPVTLAVRMTDVGGATAGLAVQLDEPATAYYVVFPTAAGAGAGASAVADACPTAGDIFAGKAPAPASVGAPPPLAARFAVPARAPATAVARLAGLVSETAYRACVVAEDATLRRNRQTVPRSVDFTTLDVTPPATGAAFVPAAAGALACSRAPPYTCAASFVATQNEPGAARWALVRNATAMPLPSPLPGPAALLAAPNASALLGGPTVVVAEGALTFPPSPSAPVLIVDLPSNAAYALLLAPRDAALPTPNAAAALVVVPLIAPDVSPPVFLEAGLASATDTGLRVGLRLDEPAVTHYVLSPSPSVPPSVAEVQAGVAAGGTASLAAGNVTSAGANTTMLLAFSGMQPGTPVDLHLWAVDATGNKQTTVTTLR